MENKMKKKSSQKKSKNSKIFRYLQRYLADESRKIILQNKSLEIKVHKLKLEEEYVQQINNT
jgi:hypothetical protein